MEILDTFGVDWRLLVIQAINFIAVLFILQRYLYKPLFAIIEKRTEKIAKGLKDADEIELERARLAADAEDVIREARSIGEKIVDQARKQALETESDLIKEANEKGARIISEAQMRAKDARAHLLRESEKEVARVAILAAEKILRQEKTTA